MKDSINKNAAVSCEVFIAHQLEALSLTSFIVELHRDDKKEQNNGVKLVQTDIVFRYNENDYKDRIGKSKSKGPSIIMKDDIEIKI